MEKSMGVYGESFTDGTESFTRGDKHQSPALKIRY
jgi:hypothetical protein